MTKCPRCNNKWKLGEKKVVTTPICTFCGFHAKDNTIKVFDSAKDAFLFIIKNYGVDDLLCNNLFSDIAPTLRDERKMLQIFRENGLLEILKIANASASEQETAINKAMSMLPQKLQSSNAALSLLYDFAEVLEWGLERKVLAPTRSDSKPFHNRQVKMVNMIHERTPAWDEVYACVRSAYDEALKLNEPRDEVFICYSNEDAKYAEELVDQLRVLEKSPLASVPRIKIWHFNDPEKLRSGQDFWVQIGAHLAKAKSVVCIASQHSIISGFIQLIEMPLIREAVCNGDINIHWLPARYCTYEVTEFRQIQTASGDATPLYRMSKPNRDVKYVGLCRKILSDFGYS